GRHIEMFRRLSRNVRERDRALTFEFRKRFRWREILSFAVRYRHREVCDAFEPRAVIFYLEIHPTRVVTREFVGDKRAGKNSCAGDDLEAVADPDQKRVTPQKFFDLSA